MSEIRESNERPALGTKQGPTPQSLSPVVEVAQLASADNLNRTREIFDKRAVFDSTLVGHFTDEE